MKLSESARHLGLMIGLVGGSLGLLAAYTHTVALVAQTTQTPLAQPLVRTARAADAPVTTGEWHPSKTKVLEMADGTTMEFAGEMSDDDMAKAIWGMNTGNPPSSVASQPVSLSFWAYFLIPALPLLGFALWGTVKLVALLASNNSGNRPRAIVSRNFEAV